MSRFPSNEWFARQGRCVCNPTLGQSCRVCDGTAAELAEERRELRRRLAEQGVHL